MRTEIIVLLALLAFALITMMVYRLTPVRSPRSSELPDRGSFVLGAWVRSWFYWFIGPLERLVLSLGLAPEVFNALGVVLGLVAMIAYATGHLAAAGWFLLAGGLADVFDGMVARARGVTSRFGAFLDSTLDRFQETAIFIGLAVWYRSTLPLVIVLVALAGSLLVSYTRARGESLGVLCKLGVLQRAERMLLLGFGSILDPTISAARGHEPGFALLFVIAVIAVGSMGTAIFRTIWIARRLRER
jgi:CDP-diacylglycerol--glycerol-3-phosphate 3-phosphatidyltransferase